MYCRTLHLRHLYAYIPAQKLLSKGGLVLQYLKLLPANAFTHILLFRRGRTLARRRSTCASRSCFSSSTTRICSSYSDSTTSSDPLSLEPSAVAISPCSASPRSPWASTVRFVPLAQLAATCAPRVHLSVRHTHR